MQQLIPHKILILNVRGLIFLKMTNLRLCKLLYATSNGCYAKYFSCDIHSCSKPRLPACKFEMLLYWPNVSRFVSSLHWLCRLTTLLVTLILSFCPQTCRKQNCSRITCHLFSVTYLGDVTINVRTFAYPFTMVRLEVSMYLCSFLTNRFWQLNRHQFSNHRKTFNWLRCWRIVWPRSRSWTCASRKVVATCRWRSACSFSQRSLTQFICNGFCVVCPVNNIYS